MKWEYRTVLFYARAHESDTREFLNNLWPGWDPPRSAPQSLIPKLNDMGARGWELVSLQPVFIDEDANVLVHGGVTSPPPSQADDMITGMIKAKVKIPIPTSTGSGPREEPSRYTNAYLCAFKRPLEE
jgi:hypothetical protein